ncbi:hypothetical protein BP5796_04425 [Coleophoma crateriformis]|uniref:Xylanolytic transcriptional activator regulatory domain-containing protein n=1 Tax=Coleophoma crateriformis TaxID=565419 RepID=A0A3D8SA04_9HELO|nr:hypothetical protein BP5796_04425 [Coleophoma crateriformis]
MDRILKQPTSQDVNILQPELEPSQLSSTSSTGVPLSSQDFCTSRAPPAATSVSQVSWPSTLLSSSPQALPMTHIYGQSQQCLPLAVQSEIVKLYIQYCDCQPLSLFDTNHLCQYFKSYSLAIQYLVLATALRFSKDPVIQEKQQPLAQELLDRARRLVFEDIVNDNVELSTLQALSLHAYLDISTGNFQRASLHVGIGVRLSRLAKLDSVEHSQTEEQRRCFWNLHLLECLTCNHLESTTSSSSDRPSFPTSLNLKLEYNKSIPITTSKCQSSGSVDLGIIGYSLQLIDLWMTSLHYVTGLNQQTVRAWAPNSGHFHLVEHIMEWESYLCKNHRYAHVRFAEHQSGDIEKNSRYWGPWLLVQFTYHGTLCLLNHPFIYLEKPGILETPESSTFSEKSSDIALLHAKHITRLIDTLEQKDVQVSDPFLGYCATIAATVNLWFCYVEDHGVKEQARSRFIKCYQFVLRLAKFWKVADRMANDLATMNVRASSWDAKAEPPFTPREIPVKDTLLMWDLVKYYPDPDIHHSSSIFHTTLDPRPSMVPFTNKSQHIDSNQSVNESDNNANSSTATQNRVESSISPEERESGSLLYQPSMPLFFTESTTLFEEFDFGISGEAGDWYESGTL